MTGNKEYKAWTYLASFPGHSHVFNALKKIRETGDEARLIRVHAKFLVVGGREKFVGQCVGVVSTYMYMLPCMQSRGAWGHLPLRPRSSMHNNTV